VRDHNADVYWLPRILDFPDTSILAAPGKRCDTVRRPCWLEHGLIAWKNIIESLTAGELLTTSCGWTWC
jgi:hypothetical protein